MITQTQKGAGEFQYRVFLGHEPTIPPQDRVRCYDAGDGRQAATAEDFPCHGQAASLVVGEAQLSGSLRRAEDSILFEQVVNDPPAAVD